MRRLAGLLVALVASSVAARASPNCPTLAEARAAYPGKYLAWHTARHCWNAMPGRRRYGTPLPAAAVRPVPAPLARPADSSPTILYPVLLQAEIALVDPQFFATEPMTAGPALIDVDEMTAGGPPPEPEANFRERWMAVTMNWIPAGISP
jgi:hypothetical protein